MAVGPPRPLNLSKEITMSIFQANQESAGHSWVPSPMRVVAALKFIHDVFVEAQAMAHEASRRHPDFG